MRDRTILTRRELFPVEGELETFDFPVSPLRLNPSPISSFTPFSVPPQSLEMGDANDNKNNQGPMRIPLKDYMFPKMTNRGEDENPYAHVRDFDDLMFLQKYRNKNEIEAMKLVLFPFSLLGKAKSWLQALRPKLITSFGMVTEAFYKKFFSFETETFRRAILRITQLHGESLNDYLERYKGLILQCPHHGIDSWVLTRNLYDGLDAETKTTVESFCLEKFTNKDDVECLDFLEEMAEKLQTWGTMRETDIQEKGGNAFGVGSNSNLEATLATILRKIESLEIGKNKMSVKVPIFHPKMQACAACDDVGHYTQDFPLIHKIRETRKDQVNMFYQKPSSFPYNQSHHQKNSSGRNNSNNYSGRPYYQRSNSNQNQGGVSFTPNYQHFQQNTPYFPPQNRKPSSDDGIKALLQSNNQLMQQFMQMNQQSMSQIKTSIAQLASGLSTRDKGTFPIQTQPNPKDQTESLHRDQANAVITLRSGKTVDNKVRIPEEKSRESPNPSTEKVVEGGKPICHIELIYQICANTGMYSSKDELLEKDVELSNTRVPHGEVIILEDNSWRLQIYVHSWYRL
ncbi:hypothetical protein GIB67_008046 [Kingdonia uniflora]|uniref:Retrotransposon gag domain-containing protein n=1 Tax=Kingdonia uniflora TaxID=39325 RepID=A0A7J7MN15_9MAGN|nr:hypothetical protein GIB67_008046 [Kingdonia uniflora]